jgi:hypothetical protein
MDLVQISVLDRILLLLTCLLASYQVVVGIDGFGTFPVIAYTIAFGVLLLAGLLLIILGYEVLDVSFVVIVSTIIPLSLSLGLVWQHLPTIRSAYLVFAVSGFLAVLITRAIPGLDRLPTVVLVLVHGVAGLTIFFLPLYLSLQGDMGPAFLLVGLGGGLIGSGGLLFSTLRMGRPVLPEEILLKILPKLLLLTTLCFVAGFRFA